MIPIEMGTEKKISTIIYWCRYHIHDVTTAHACACLLGNHQPSTFLHVGDSTWMTLFGWLTFRDKVFRDNLKQSIRVLLIA